MPIDMVVLSGFDKTFGYLEVDKEKLEAKICLDKNHIQLLMVKHPLLGEVPAYKAGIYDLCIRAYEELTKRLEN